LVPSGSWNLISGFSSTTAGQWLAVPDTQSVLHWLIGGCFYMFSGNIMHSKEHSPLAGVKQVHLSMNCIHCATSKSHSHIYIKEDSAVFMHISNIMPSKNDPSPKKGSTALLCKFPKNSGILPCRFQKEKAGFSHWTNIIM